MLIIIYGDFENILKPGTDTKKDGPNTERYQDHIFSSYDHKLVFVDEWYSRPYFGNNAVGCCW